MFAAAEFWDVAPAVSAGDFLAPAAALLALAAMMVDWPKLIRRLRLDREVCSDEWLLRPCRALARAAYAVQDWLDPKGAEWRSLGRYLRALPPLSGLTPYDEDMAAARAVPDPAERARLTRLIEKYGRKPSEAERVAARRRAGMPAYRPADLACLLAGREPPAWALRRERAARRAARV